MSEYRLGLIYDSPVEQIRVEFADILTEDQFVTLNQAITK